MPAAEAPLEGEDEALLAQRFSVEELDENDHAEPEADEPSPEAPATEHARDQEITDRLADAIQRIFGGTLPDAQQAGQIESLLESMVSLGVGLFSLNRHPWALIRLARLCNRHWRLLSEEAREATRPAFLWMGFEHPEAADLLVELAQAGNRELGQRISLRLAISEPESGESKIFRGTNLGPRLLDLLDRADSLPRPDSTRLLALSWLELALRPEAIPTLRKLLRRPHLGIRWRALALLVEGFSKCPMTAEDVLFLLEEQLEHPPQLDELSWSEEPRHYADYLRRAVASVRPPCGAELLLRIASAARTLRKFSRCACNEAWTLETLAAAYPESAVSLLDTCLGSGSSYRRLHAVCALAHLPEPLCRPHLLFATADGAPLVAERARELWLERYGTVCPLPLLAGFPTELLIGPASDRLLERLLVLRSPSAEARLAMIEALLAEAPDREALVLITFALADDHLLLTRRRRVPRDKRRMTSRLYRLFGAAAVAALCWLAERYPEEGGDNWFYELRHLAESCRIPKRDLGLLRKLAVQRLDAPGILTRQIAWSVLANLGAPPELRERIVALLCSRDAESYSAVGILRKWPRDPMLDRQIAETAQVAWAARDSDLLGQVMIVGFARNIKALSELAVQVVNTWLASATKRRADAEEASAPTAALAEQCARHLLDKGMLPTTWMLESLRAPESPAFILAAYLQDRDASEDVRQALLCALDSPARAGESAEVAARTLLRLGAVDPSDSRLYSIAARAQRDSQWFLLFQLAHNNAPNELLRPQLADLLKRAPQEDAEDLDRFLRAFERVIGSEDLQTDIAQIPDPSLRRALESQLGFADPQEPFWQDEAEEL